MSVILLYIAILYFLGKLQLLMGGGEPFSEFNLSVAKVSFLLSLRILGDPPPPILLIIENKWLAVWLYETKKN